MNKSKPSAAEMRERIYRRHPLQIVIDDDLPYERDHAAQAFVAAFPGGATLEAVGDAFGVSRERIRQIESKALGKIAEACGDGVLKAFLERDPEGELGDVWDRIRKGR